MDKICFYIVILNQLININLAVIKNSKAQFEKANSKELLVSLNNHEYPVLNINSNENYNKYYNLKKIENSVEKQYTNETLKFRETIENIKIKSKKSDIIFLIDSSSSVGKSNFYSELSFVSRLLKHFDLTYNYSRIALITFSSQGKVIRHVDQISAPSESEDQCSALSDQIPQINFFGGGTYTWGALKEAEEIFDKGRNSSKKYIFLISDGFSNGRNPIEMADKLKKNNIIIFTIGIQSGNSLELSNISSTPKENHNYLLGSFKEFEKLIRNALHKDHKLNYKIKLTNSSRCNILCERESLPFNEALGITCCSEKATCECGIPSGEYSCTCKPGYIGTGLIDDCQPCVRNTYWVNSDFCRPCPDINHMTTKFPATNFEDCMCKKGFKRTANGRCEGITCPVLKPPVNGYFVKQAKCVNVLNAACGARCMSGYQLTGTSVRLCLENGTWSGTRAECILKNCPSLQVPYFGMITCRNKDLELYYDYSPRNITFMKHYEDESRRVTESMPIDTECSYKCSAGYYLIGSKTRNCLPLSKWDGLQTNCKPVLCSPLQKPKYGEYELSDCTEFKVPFGTNCTLICPPGFTIEGPTTKTCNGKKNGVWSHRNKNPKCVDKTPPEIICPKPITLKVGINDDSVLIKSLPDPLYLNDSSNLNVSFWINPNIDSVMGTALKIGLHLFIYTATDSFTNKAECLLEVHVVDTTPPIIENCIDPSDFFISSDINKNQFIEWDEPIFVDNSKELVSITKSLDFGHLNVGKYQAVYIGEDTAGNMNKCILNITVKVLSCGKLDSPLNGHSYCARNSTHTWCDVSCNLGYTLHDNDNNVENMRYFCSNNNPFWKIDPLPDCTIVELPNNIEKILTISIDSEESLCLSNNQVNKLKALTLNLKSVLCNDLEDCDILTPEPDCSEEDISNDINDPNYYRVYKRHIDEPKSNKIRSNVRIRLMTRVGRKLGVWRKNETVDDNFRLVKQQIQYFNTNDTVRKTLNDLNIDLRKIKIDELIRCPDGSILKKNVCVQCPRGTFQDVVHNTCEYCSIGTYADKSGQKKCFQCPENYSTKKIGRIDLAECKQLCPPGTIAKIKSPRRQLRPGFSNPRSLMPFCRRCNAGEYQPYYDKTICLLCPNGFHSDRGSQSLVDCVPKAIHPCDRNSNICNNQGICIAERGNLYSCLCYNGYEGSHCEKAIDLCLTLPCYNNGICHNNGNGTVTCECLSKFRGTFCEELKYSCANTLCHNQGVCYETDDDVICDCPFGYDGRYCEITTSNNYCSLSPCENGKCINTPEGYYCQCLPGYFGKRCHLKPCDYFPCHKNANCVDLLHYPTTRESFICKCPSGLKGSECNQIHSPCESHPCKNNGICIPKILRQLDDNSQVNDDVFLEYQCKCQPFFYGENCEIFTTPDYIMNFPRLRSITNFIPMEGPNYDLNEITCCFWMKSNDTFNYGTIISYATDDEDNIFTFTDHSGFVLYINGESTVTDIIANDGEWHFICIAWTKENGFYEIYYDGNLEHTGFQLSSGKSLSRDGVFVIGQEQDLKGGGFSETESFIGSIAYLDIWDKFLQGHELLAYYTSCTPYKGNLYSWTDFKEKIRGSIQIEKSQFCQECSNDLEISNGYIRIVDNTAWHYCNTGYILRGHHNRFCLRTSKWSTINLPYCSIVECATLPKINNGMIEYAGTVYRSEAVYKCNNGFLLIGSERRVCGSDGNWSKDTPWCLSKVKCKSIQLSPEVSAIYSDDNSILSNLTEYPIGTIAEIMCNGIATDSVLTCLENGEWDDLMPDICESFSSPILLRNTSPKTTKKAVTAKPKPKYTTRKTTTLKTTKKPLTTTTKPKPKPTVPTTVRTTITTKKTTKATTTTTTTKKPKVTTARTTTSTSTIIPEKVSIKPVEPSSNFANHIFFPNKQFWVDLKNYLFFGCNSKLDKEIALLCIHETLHRNFTDLTTFQITDKSINYEIQLLKIFDKANHIKDLNTLKYEDFFHLLLYNNTKHQEKSLLENSLRYTLCQCIDSLISDGIVKDSDEIQDADDVIEKLKNLLWKSVIPVFNDYKNRFSVNSKESSTTDSSDNALRTKRMSFNEYFIDFDEEDEIDEIKCSKIRNNEIPENAYMTIAEQTISDNFKIGTVIYFNCIEGFKIYGSREIQCLMNGRWSKILAKCLKISCGRPKLLNNAKIIKGSSYMFEDEIKINCENNKEVNLRCQSDGKWYPTAYC